MMLIILWKKFLYRSDRWVLFLKKRVGCPEKLEIYLGVTEYLQKNQVKYNIISLLIY